MELLIRPVHRAWYFLAIKWVASQRDLAHLDHDRMESLKFLRGIFQEHYLEGFLGTTRAVGRDGV